MSDGNSEDKNVICRHIRCFQRHRLKHRRATKFIAHLPLVLRCSATAGGPSVLKRLMSTWMYYVLWAVILIAAVILQLMPFFFFFMIFGLAIGFSSEVAMFVVPAVFIFMIFAASLMASKIREAAGRAPGRGAAEPERVAAGPLGPGGQAAQPGALLPGFAALQLNLLSDGPHLGAAYPVIGT